VTHYLGADLHQLLAARDHPPVLNVLRQRLELREVANPGLDHRTGPMTGFGL
jgi:hypothetical protein